ncbi:MAG: dienelactone hydrolase family protein [Ornithinimicrobium sp.]|uniref:dienelactone hydrolase family protein n=1 Tax=Ornithinimicrobium sp. TaxID=1977084 RepID=UPI0026DFEC85|nr:dienelactone hydrolase family protein [Ornithinimicrobium sp.]MDO5741208.1 dienelactone hydrolase family protein [Ornithinimicrobium sp.]
MTVLHPVQHEIATADGPLPGLLWLPEGACADAPVPGIVLFQEIFGVGSYIQSRCADLAALGYAVLAPQFFARLRDGDGGNDGEVPVVEEAGADGLAEAMSLASRLDWAQATRDGLAARDDLASMAGVNEERVGLLGFCFGGGLAFDVAASAAMAEAPVAALVSFYGSSLPSLLPLAEQVQCPSLHHFGDADAYIPLESVEAIRDAVTAGGTRPQVRFEVYEGAGHAFDNPAPLFHHAAASAAAWSRTEAFLAEALPSRIGE